MIGFIYIFNLNFFLYELEKRFAYKERCHSIVIDPICLNLTRGTEQVH